MADANGIIRPDSAEDCLVLLEELIRTNRTLVAENEKLRQEHEQSSKSQAEILQRFESRLHEREFIPCGGRRSNPRRRSARNSTAIPAACRVSLIIERNAHLKEKYKRSTIHRHKRHCVKVLDCGDWKMRPWSVH